MPEPAQNATTTDGNNTGGSTSDAGAAFTPITTQDDLNRVIADRISRERSKYADYDALKTKAEQFDAIEQANKTELQKAQDAATAANATATQAQQDALRLRVAIAKGLPASLVDRLRGSNEQELTADADELLKLVTPPAAGGQQPAGPRPDLAQGARGGTATQGDPGKEFEVFINRQLNNR